MPETPEPSADRDREPAAERGDGGAPTGAGRGRPVALLAAVAAVAVALAVVALTRGGGDDEPAVRTAAGAGAATVEPAYGPVSGTERRNDDDPLAQGRVDAPVVMVEFADFRCPFCAKFAVDTLPELVRRYVDRGVLRIEWRDFPIFGGESERAARAGRAAAAQGRFWEFYAELFAAAPASGHPDMPLAKLERFARSAGVRDIARFRRDVASKATQGSVDADRDQALALGIGSTPAFVVNGFPLLGAQPLEQFVELIERARGGAGG